MSILGMDGNDLSGLGAIVTALATVYSVEEQKDFNDEMLSLEKQRVSDNKKTDKKRQDAYEAVWSTSNDIGIG
jgi:hypothetical protein